MLETLQVNIPNWSDLGHWRPELTLLATFLIAVIGDLIARGRRPWVPFTLALAGMLLALGFGVTGLGAYIRKRRTR